jgi:hypothetical protein
MYDRDLVRSYADEVFNALMAAKARNAEQGSEDPITATLSSEEINKAVGRKRLTASLRSQLISDLLAHPELELVASEGRNVVVRTAPPRIITSFASLDELKGYGK